MGRAVLPASLPPGRLILATTSRSVDRLAGRTAHPTSTPRPSRCSVQANAVGEDRLQPVKIGSPDTRMLIDHQARQVLPYALPHDARLAMIHPEPFFMQDRGHMRGEPLHTALKIFTARKRKIVGVPRIAARGAGSLACPTQFIGQLRRFSSLEPADGPDPGCQRPSVWLRR